MKTPIFDFVENLIAKNGTRLFMPGHKGKDIAQNQPFASAYSHDITEITGADILYGATGIIRQSEQNAAKIFGAKETIYSTNGSTLCIQAMLFLASRTTRKIIAGRNAHIAFINACILLDLEPIWVLSEVQDRYGVCGLVTAEQIESSLKENKAVGAVYVTSPDYLGNVSDITAISEVCKKYKVMLICDNAHGSYLRFGDSHGHPLELGATMCCDSAHKSLPVLTGGAYLHLSYNCEFTYEDANDAMKIFASTSPSYLILQSLDLCNRYLCEQADLDFVRLKHQIEELKTVLTAHNILYLDNKIDYAKITINIHSMCLSSEMIGERLMQNNIEWEYKNEDYLVLLFSPMITTDEFQKLARFFTKLKKSTPDESLEEYVEYSLPKRVMSPRAATFKRFIMVETDEAVGKISAQAVANCPPGVPIIVPGEIISEKIKNICKNGGNYSLKVLY